MANQIHSASEYLTATKLIRDGVIGKIKEVHSWQDKKGNFYTGLSGALPTRAHDPNRERDIAEGQVTTVDLEPRAMAEELGAGEMRPPPGTPVAVPTDIQITRTYVSLDAAENPAANLAEDPAQDAGDARQATDSTPDGSKSG